MTVDWDKQLCFTIANLDEITSSSALLCFQSFLLFGFSVHRLLPPVCIFNHNVKCFLSSYAVHQIFDETCHPIKFKSLCSLPYASNLHYGAPKLSSVRKNEKVVRNDLATLKNSRAHLLNSSANVCVDPIGERNPRLASTKYALCDALNSCAKTLNRCLGVQIHGLIIHNGYEDNLIINSSLVDFYAKCGLIEDARRVFNSMEIHDQISWSSIISGYGRMGCITETTLLFKQMLATDFTPNSFTYVGIINSYVAAETQLEQGALLHAHVIKLGFDANSFVASALIDYYLKCGEIGTAASILNSTVQWDDVLYNSMISGYSQNLQHEEALKLFSRMRHSDFRPTHYTMSIVLNACGCQIKLGLGKQVHCLVIKVGSLCSLFVSCALINMYSKCGSIGEARAIFDQTVEKNVVLCTSMVSGYAEHGRALEGLNLFDQLMMEGRFVADHVCFTAILTACSHAGLLDEGISYFKKIKDCGLAPNLDQYACLVDLFARKGQIDKAKQLMEEMPYHANNVMLSSFLSSCRSFGAIKPGIEAANQLISSQPNDVSTYITLAQIYAEAGLWDQVAFFKKLMEERGSRTRDGRSWVEVYEN